MHPREKINNEWSARPNFKVSKIVIFPTKTVIYLYKVLASHLHRIGVLDSSNCPLCGKDEIMDRHYIQECSVLRGESMVKRFWSARSRLMRYWLFLLLFVPCVLVVQCYVTTMSFSLDIRNKKAFTDWKIIVRVGSLVCELLSKKYQTIQKKNFHIKKLLN